ncbi:MAG: HEPN domain-containing protein [Planctomycetes bacterium]|nr:HEPN domain-containing protein [Planctomycetota bacterium]
MADSPDYRHWVEIAEGDLRAAQKLAADDPVGFGNHVLFHCQQSAEKYLKACLRFRDVDFPKVHDFQRLLRLCEQLSPEFRQLDEPTGRLQPFAVQARYSSRNPVAETVTQALEDAAAVRAFCRRFTEVGAAAQDPKRKWPNTGILGRPLQRRQATGFAQASSATI